MATRRAATREEKLTLKLRKLTEKIREIEASREYKAVWFMFLQSGGQYSGGDWAKELVAAENLLANSDDKDSE